MSIYNHIRKIKTCAKNAKKIIQTAEIRKNTKKQQNVKNYENTTNTPNLYTFAEL